MQWQKGTGSGPTSRSSLPPAPELVKPTGEMLPLQYTKAHRLYTACRAPPPALEWREGRGLETKGAPLQATVTQDGLGTHIDWELDA